MVHTLVELPIALVLPTHMAERAGLPLQVVAHVLLDAGSLNRIRLAHVVLNLLDCVLAAPQGLREISGQSDGLPIMVVHHPSGESNVVLIQINILYSLLMPQIFVRVFVRRLKSIGPLCVVQFVRLQDILQHPGIVPHDLRRLRRHVDSVEACAAHVVGVHEVVWVWLQVLHRRERVDHLLQGRVEVVVDLPGAVQFLLVRLFEQHLRPTFIIIPGTCVLLLECEQALVDLLDGSRGVVEQQLVLAPAALESKVAGRSSFRNDWLDVVVFQNTWELFV